MYTIYQDRRDWPAKVTQGTEPELVAWAERELHDSGRTLDDYVNVPRGADGEPARMLTDEECSKAAREILSEDGRLFITTDDPHQFVRIAADHGIAHAAWALLGLPEEIEHVIRTHDDACIWVGADEILAYASRQEMESDKDNSRALLRMSMPTAGLVRGLLIARGVDYESN